MVYPPELLDRLQEREPKPWEGIAFRHMFVNYPPDTENTRGARWNPPSVSAMYLSTTRDGALAEAEYQLLLQSPRPRVRRTIYEVSLSVAGLADLTDRVELEELGVSRADLADTSMRACRAVGGAAAWLGYDSILVPSARSTDANLVIYPLNCGADMKFDVVDTSPV